MKETKPVIRDFYADTEQIAQRFNKPASTIKRWIREFNLPVLQRTPRSTYMAYEDDIVNVWLPRIKECLGKNNPCQ